MKQLFPNPVVLWAGISLLVYLGLYGLKKILTTRMSKFKWDEIVVHTMEQTTHLWMVGTAMYVAASFVPHDKSWNKTLDTSFFILSMIQVAIWSNYLIDKWIMMSINRKTRSNPAAASSISLIQVLTKIFIFSALLLFTLNNLGIKITTILAGLGVGGIAVALALQRILGDLFSSLSIVMDKPFVVGDFIVLDQYMGEVERIGLKTTRLRSLGGEQIIISNSDLLSTRIRNYKRMHERRVMFALSLPLTTKGADMRKAVSLIQAVIASKEKVRPERCHFMSIGKVSMDIEVVYYVLTDDYNTHMNIQQDILLDIQRIFEAENLSFARPVQTVTVEPQEFIMRTETASNPDKEQRQSVS
ncbi:MAG: mechanosensitive ion channel family protein [Bacteriovoracaceae bacterium]